MTEEPQEVIVNERPLVCAHCGGRRFFARTLAVDDAGASLLGFEWFTQRGTHCHICHACGHMHWFMPQA